MKGLYASIGLTPGNALILMQEVCASGIARRGHRGHTHTQTDGRQSDVNFVLSRFLYSMSGLGVDGVWLKPDRKLVGQ